MARKLIVSGARLPFLWNVSSKVGDNKTCVNARTDVELVNFFLNYIANIMPGTPRITSFAPVSGNFEVTTAYWIYSLQMSRKEVFSGGSVDGVISPASSFDPARWTIVYFNGIVNQHNSQLFNTLDKHPALSSALRAELSQARR